MPEKRKGSTKKTGRDYSYDLAYQKKPEQAEAQAARKRARRLLEAEGKVRPFDSKDVDHRNSNPKDNAKSNLRVMSASKNRARTKNGKKV